MVYKVDGRPTRSHGPDEADDTLRQHGDLMDEVDAPNGTTSNDFCYPMMNLRSFFNFLSLVLAIVSFVLDILLLYTYFYGNMFDFWLTLGILVVTGVICSLISIQWYFCIPAVCRCPEKSAKKIVFTTASLFQLGRICRLTEIQLNMFLGWFKQDYKKRRLRATENNIIDAAFIGMVESYIEDAPQLLLQIYLLVESGDIMHLRSVFVVFSLVAVFFSLAGNYITNKKLDPNRQADIGSCHYIMVYFVYTFWRILEIGPRLFLFTLLLVYFSLWWLFIVPVIHMVVMFILNAKCFKPEHERLCICNCLLYVWAAYLGNFHFYNMQSEGRTSKYDAGIFYTIHYAENFVMILALIFLTHTGVCIPSYWSNTAYGLVAGGFVSHLTLVFLFYKYLHPWKKKENQSQINVPDIEESHSEDLLSNPTH